MQGKKGFRVDIANWTFFGKCDVSTLKKFLRVYYANLLFFFFLGNEKTVKKFFTYEFVPKLEKQNSFKNKYFAFFRKCNEGIVIFKIKICAEFAKKKKNLNENIFKLAFLERC